MGTRRFPTVYTVPGIIVHQSALKGGELLKIPTIGA
jgi:hypothetical protein